MQMGIFIYSFTIIVLLCVIIYLINKFSKTANDFKKLRYDLDVQANSFMHLKENTELELNRLESFIVTISDIARNITSSSNEAEIFNIILNKTVNFLDAQECAIFMVDKNDPQLKLVNSLGYDEKTLSNLTLFKEESSGFIGWAAKVGRFISAYETAQDVTLEALKTHNKLDILFAQPVVLQNEVLAVISVGRIKKRLKETEVVRFMSIISNFSSIAINNIRLMNKFKEQSIRDGLTGLYNHSYFQSFLEDKFKQSQKESFSVSLVLMDLDFFKSFNDAYGHQAGDVLLCGLGSILQNSIDTGSIAARYGGEEFVLVLLNKDKEEAVSIAQSIRQRVSAHIFRFENKDIKVTLSAGVSTFKPQSNQRIINKDELIKEADLALYQAKKEGRNKVICK